MKKFDVHHHLIEEHGYVDRLLAAKDAHNIERTVLLGVGRDMPGLFVKGNNNGSVADNDAVEKAVNTHPDRFVGLGYIRLGVDPNSLAGELIGRGFSGFKFTLPADRYDHESFYPVYEKAQAADIPCLFHTGVLTTPVPVPGQNVKAFNMEVIHLDAIARDFPNLKIIAAHLGIQSYQTTLVMMRILPNIYADLSGGLPGWTTPFTEEDWKKMFWWEGAHKKVLFGTDVHCNQYEACMEMYQRICNAVGWNKSQQEDVFHNNAAGILEKTHVCHTV